MIFRKLNYFRVKRVLVASESDVVVVMKVVSHDRYAVQL